MDGNFDVKFAEIKKIDNSNITEITIVEAKPSNKEQNIQDISVITADNKIITSNSENKEIKEVSDKNQSTININNTESGKNLETINNTTGETNNVNITQTSTS